MNEYQINMSDSYSNFQYERPEENSSTSVTQAYQAKEGSDESGILNNVPTIRMP